MRGILSGLRVIEGSAFVAAPTAGMAMAQMGAEVIRFDPIGGGLDVKRWPVTADGRSLYWTGLNKGKKSICVDIRSPEGRELLTRMITQPGENNGIFLTNFPPSGWMSYETLKAKREDLIMVNIQGNRDGSSEVDYTVNPATGFPGMTGPLGGETPVNHVLPAWDIGTGYSAVTGLLAAERHRRLTGEGQFVSVALSDIAFATLANLGFVGERQINGTERKPGGNDLFGAFGRDFATSDGRRVMIVAISGRQWQALVKTTGIEAAVKDIEAKRGLNLADEGDRYKATDDIARAIVPWCAAQTFAEVTAKLKEGGVSWGAYQNVGQALAEDWRLSPKNPMFAEIDQPGIGRVLAPGTPLEFGGADRLPPVPAPQLGQHTDEILSGMLGLSDGEIARLHDSGVVAGPA